MTENQQILNNLYEKAKKEYNKKSKQFQLYITLEDYQEDYITKKLRI